METELIIEGSGFPPFSARGCRQDLSLVPSGEFRRTVNGDLIYLGPVSHKYRSVIACEDKTTLANEGALSRGSVIRIACLQRLWQKGSGVVTLERDCVGGSLAVTDECQSPVSFEMIDKRHVKVEGESPAYIGYRPWLSMRVVDLTLYTDEWGLKAGWKLTLEEV